MFPLISIEHKNQKDLPYDVESVLPVKWQNKTDNLFPKFDLESRLVWGSLPGIVTADEDVRSDVLKSYAIIYLEEEIRREVLIKDWSAFLKFLKLAATESNMILNYAALSREAGVSQPTVKSYYQILEDMFIGVFIPPFTKSKRKNILTTSKFLFFDLGVRNASADIPLNKSIVSVNPGYFFEHWVGVELWKRCQYLNNVKLYFFRTRDGVEIDYIIEKDNELILIEVKWTGKPNKHDCKHIIKFIDENHKKSVKGFIVCRCLRPLKLHEKVMAIPWEYI